MKPTTTFPQNLTPPQTFDQNHIWHPYSASPSLRPNLLVDHTQGSLITLKDGHTLVDGMSSWWAAIHGYNPPQLQEAMHRQIDKMPHIMFGGLTHEPAIELCQTLIDLTPAGLEKVFLADSGSVAMEVAIKVAMQYWMSLGQPQKHRLLTVRNGYHGDTFATMAISDPENGMHHLFTSLLPQHLFAPAPTMGFSLPDTEATQQDIQQLERLLSQHAHEVAAVVIEPIVQGAGGMRFYRPSYLKQLRRLCDQYEVLLICDEIATGFGRTGKLFASNWAEISPDILCVGKALTGGQMTLAAMLCTHQIADCISQGDPGVLMHGPTFMGNPLACATANASIDLLLNSPWQTRIEKIEQHLTQALMPLANLDGVKDVRTLGAIGVVELERDDLGAQIQNRAVAEGVWLRPFGSLVYTMPAFNIPDTELQQLTQGIVTAIQAAVEK